MDRTDEVLRERVRDLWRRRDREQAVPFDTVWRAAQDRHAAARRRYRYLAAAAAVVAAIVIGVTVQQPSDEPSYIEVAELLDSTSWSAPSDVLLPDREFDIYQDMPVLFESTEPAGGTLL